MKRFLATATLLIASAAIANAQKTTTTKTVTTQTATTAATTQQSLKEKLKKDLQLADAAIDNIATIQTQYDAQVKEINSYATLNQKEKAAKLQVMEDRRREKLQEVLTNSEFELVEAYLSQQKAANKKQPASTVTKTAKN